MAAICSPRIQVNRGCVYHLVCRFKADQTDTLQPVQSMRVTLSDNDFIHELAFNGTTTKSYGWYSKPLSLSSNVNVVELENILEVLLPKALVDGSANTCHVFSQNKYEGDLVGIFLGKLSVATSCSLALDDLNGKTVSKSKRKQAASETHFFLLLYLNLVSRGKVYWNVGLVGQTAKRNNAIETRLREIQNIDGDWNCLQGKVDLKVGDTWVGFQPGNYDLTVPASHYRSMMIFQAKRSLNYDELLLKWQRVFAPVIPASHTSVKVKQPPPTIGLSQQHIDALDLTTSAMEIETCGKQFQVKSIGRSNVIYPVSFSDKGTSVTGPDYFPVDVEGDVLSRDVAQKKNLFSQELTIQQLYHEIYFIQKYVQQQFAKEFQPFLLGLVSHCWYSSLKWRIAAPEPSSDPIRNVSLTYDVDQLSLDVRDIGRFMYTPFYQRGCPFKRNADFLEYHFNNLLQQVFSGQLPSEVNELNFNVFSGQTGVGHTLLPPHVKATFSQILDHTHEGDKIKMAVSFTARKSSSPLEHWPWDFDEFENSLLSSYHTMDWKKRMFTSLVLVAKFLNDKLGSDQGFEINRILKHGLWNALEGSSVLECNGGVLLQMLGVMQVAALEEWLFHCNPAASSFAISLSVESYGFKKRHVVHDKDLCGTDVDSRADEIARYFCRVRPTCVLNIIPNFSRYCAMELGVKDPNKNNMYYGVGVTCRSVDAATNTPLYAAFPLHFLREYLSRHRDKTPQNTSHDASFDGADDDENDSSPSTNNAKRGKADQEVVLNEGDEDDVAAATKINMNIASICEQFGFPHWGRTLIILVDFLRNSYHEEPFAIFGSVLPSFLMPYSAKMDAKFIRQMSLLSGISVFAVKFQYYCVDARYAPGECLKLNKTSTSTATAASCLKNLSFTTGLFPCYSGLSQQHYVAQRFFRYDHHKKYLDDCLHNLEGSCDFVRSDGAAARMEVTFKVKNVAANDYFADLKQSFIGLLEVVQHTLKHFDITKELATCIEFFGKGVRSRTDFVVSELFPSEATSERIAELLRYVVEEVGIWQKFYNGIHMFYAKAVVCKKLSVAASRPILSSLSEELHKRLQTRYPDMERVVEILFARTGINLIPGVQLHCQPSARFNISYEIDGYACRHCGFILSKGKSIDHPCVKTEPLDVSDCIAVKSDEFKAFVQDRYSQLNEEQRMVVDVVTNDIENPACLFLTGFAGTGKTRTLNCVKAKLMSLIGVSRVLSVSYTKAAANEVRGSSIHFLLNLGKEGDLNSLSAKDAFKLLRCDSRKEAALVSAHTLIIDEVSLLTGSGLDLINETLKLTRNNQRLPFGGMQVILCGDCLQLPPIHDSKCQAQRPTLFFFESDTWYHSNFRVGYLKQIYRQSQMTDLLNRIRDGEPTDEDIDFLNTQCGRGMSQSVLAFLIDEMAKLNYHESTKRRVESGEEKAIADKLKYKVKNTYIDGRCGNYNGDLLFPITSGDPVVDNEFQLRGVIDDTNNGVDILTKLENHFIVGVENVESDHFSTAFESKMSSTNAHQLTAAFEAIANDTYYWFEGSAIGPHNQKDIETELENSEHARPANKMEDHHFQNYTSLQAVRQRWQNANVMSRCKRLLLYVGLTVIFTSNSVSSFVANNTQGVIEELVYDESDPVKLKSLRIRPIGKEGFQQPLIDVYRDRRFFFLNG